MNKKNIPFYLMNHSDFLGFFGKHFLMLSYKAVNCVKGLLSLKFQKKKIVTIIFSSTMLVFFINIDMSRDSGTAK